MNIFYVLIRTTENYQFDKFRTAGVTGNATNYKNSQGDNPVCSTRDEISQPSLTISPRAATGLDSLAAYSSISGNMSTCCCVCSGTSNARSRKRSLFLDNVLREMYNHKLYANIILIFEPSLSVTEYLFGSLFTSRER